MSSDMQLSEQNKNTKLAKGSLLADKNLFAIFHRLACEDNQYNFKITHERRLMNTELYSHFTDSSSRHVLESERTGVRPDGGVLLLEHISGKRMVVLVGENKKQGFGEVNKAKGNAVERLSKNIQWFRDWTCSESILPFVAFIHGRDFSKGSYVIDRVASMGNFYKLNQLNILKDKNGMGGASLFCRVQPFTKNEMYKYCRDILECACMYYAQKYGENNFKKND